jgi:hypothetical protein
MSGPIRVFLNTLLEPPEGPEMTTLERRIRRQLKAMPSAIAPVTVRSSAAKETGQFEVAPPPGPHERFGKHEPAPSASMSRFRR